MVPTCPILYTPIKKASGQFRMWFRSFYMKNLFLDFKKQFPCKILYQLSSKVWFYQHVNTHIERFLLRWHRSKPSFYPIYRQRLEMAFYHNYRKRIPSAAIDTCKSFIQSHSIVFVSHIPFCRCLYSPVLTGSNLLVQHLHLSSLFLMAFRNLTHRCRYFLFFPVACFFVIFTGTYHTYSIYFILFTIFLGSILVIQLCRSFLFSFLTP